MATPTYATVLNQLNTFIVANGNNEITANVLNPILKLILDFANNTIGDLEDLTTDEKENIVAAINSLKENIENINTNSVQLYNGVDDPYTTPPASFTYADFYMQLDFTTSEPIKLWQFNGFEWVDYSEVPSTQSDNVQNNSNVSGSSVTDALNTLLVNSAKFPKVQITATEGQTVFPLGTTVLARMVFRNGFPLDDSDWSQTGSNATTTFPFNLNDIFKII